MRFDHRSSRTATSDSASTAHSSAGASICGDLQGMIASMSKACVLSATSPSPIRMSIDHAYDVAARLRPFIARRISPAEVDDVLQDVFVRMHRGLPALRDDERFTSWKLQVARRTVEEHLCLWV